ncbi:MAG TPA: oxidoreductase [Terriglobales bacterium]|nr:oxidoreductase [Terriglobales bacterium]
MVNVGLVGFGFAGRVFHAPIISAVSGLKLRAILERSGDEAAKAYPSTAVVRSVDELLAIPEINLVVIATPNTSHYPLARQFLLAGKDVVVDKPFTTTCYEADELVRLAQERGRLLTVYQNRRFDGDFRTIRELITAGQLGRIVLFETHFDRYRMELRPGAWRERPEAGSGIFFDLGVHLLDQALLLFGPPQALTADIRIEREGAQVDDAFDVVLHYPRTRAVLRASMIALAPDLRFLLRGENGAYVKHGLDPQEDALKRGETPRDDTWGREEREKWGALYRPENDTITGETIPTQPGNYCLFYANVRDAILEKTQICVTHEQMLEVMQAVELAQESSGQRRTVEWSPR